MLRREPDDELLSATRCLDANRESYAGRLLILSRDAQSSTSLILRIPQHCAPKRISDC